MKKIIAGLMAVVLSVGIGSVSAEEAAKGDINGDGRVNVQDASAVLQIYAENASGSGSSSFSDVQISAADIDGDGKVLIRDASAVLRYYAYNAAGLDADWEKILSDSKGMYIPLSPVKTDDELFGDYFDEAEELLADMTTEQKVSQIFLAGYPGYSTALSQVQDAPPCGYVLFANDFRNQTPSSVKPQFEKLKETSSFGLLLGGDEEGGDVTRVSCFSSFRSSAFPSPMKLYAKGGLDAVFADASEKSALLKSIGLNYNLAPVADITKKSSSYIYSRTLGQSPQITAEYTAGVVDVFNSDGMLSTLKHFPGYGDNLDTHTLVSVDSRSKETFMNEDLLPFISGIEAGVPMIMVNHNIVTCMDSAKPASLSEEVHRFLREELGFSGLIVTDGLTMGAVQKYAENGEAAVQAVLCGNDVIATLEYDNQRAEVLKAVNDGRIPEIMINDAVRRILACKYYYGVIK